MTSRSPYETPPDGDFARYVEQLSRMPPEVTGAPTMVKPTGQAAGRRPPRTAQAAVASAHEVRAAARPFLPVWHVLRWGVVVLVGYQVASALYLPLANFGGAVLLAYLAFAFFRLRALPWQQLVDALNRHRT